MFDYWIHTGSVRLILSCLGLFDILYLRGELKISYNILRPNKTRFWTKTKWQCYMSQYDSLWLNPDFPLGAFTTLFMKWRRIFGLSRFFVANSSLLASHSQQNRIEECLEKCIRHLYSISKSIVSRRRAADSAVARQGEGNNDTIGLEMELQIQMKNLG